MRVSQLEDVYAVNHVASRSSPGYTKLTKAVKKLSTLKCLDIWHVKDLPLLFTLWARIKAAWCGQLGMLRNAFLWIILIFLEVVDLESWVTSGLPFLFDPSTITKLQS